MIDMAMLRLATEEPADGPEAKWLLPPVDRVREEPFGLERNDLPDSMPDLAAPAFLVHANGAVWLANEAGMEVLEADPRQTRDAIAATLRQTPRQSVFRLVSKSATPAFLVILRGERPRASELRDAVSRWHLTRREKEVIELLVLGDANKEIAAKLSLSLRTVELHVTAILRKAGVESRARLIASYLTRR